METAISEATGSGAADIAGAAEFAALLDAAVDGIMVIDERGDIVRVNHATERMFGYAAAELIGRPLAMLMAADESRRHDNHVADYLRTGRRRIIGRGREVMALRKDGAEFPVSLSVGEARIGNQVRFVGLMRDLTADKRAEEETLRQREQMIHVSRLTTMGEMAAGIAHEVNQPLSAIATYTAACMRLLNQGPRGIEEVRLALQQIDAQAHRAGDVIRRIRNFTRSRELARHDTSIRALIDEIRPLLELDAKANSARLEIRVDTDLPPITVDHIQIQQVLLNLVRNGIDAMVGKPSAERHVMLHARVDSPDTVRIEITDNGSGISDAVRDNLFLPFFTTKSGGMGMGLAISRSIITAHGGRLDCRNNPEGGAMFYVILPTRTEE